MLSQNANAAALSDDVSVLIGAPYRFWVLFMVPFGKGQLDEGLFQRSAMPPVGWSHSEQSS